MTGKPNDLRETVADIHRLSRRTRTLMRNNSLLKLLDWSTLASYNFGQGERAAQTLTSLTERMLHDTDKDFWRWSAFLSSVKKHAERG